MTISTTSNRIVYTGNGATIVFPYAFLIPDLSSLVVSLVLISSGNSTVVSPTLYSVSGLGNPAGGNVTMNSAPSALYKLVVERILAETQQTDLPNQSAVYPEDIEDALDYLTMLVQQLQDQINRSIVFSNADTVTTTLPTATARANLFLGFNASGDPVAVSGLTAGTTVSAAMIPVVTAPTTAAALTALGIPGSLLDSLIPAGTIWDYCLVTVPTGFALAYGQACTGAYPVLRAALVAAGSPFGTNGVDPLIPDTRSRDLAGKSNMGGVDNGILTGGTVLGAALGVQTVALAAGNLPTHTHTSPTVTDPAHRHNSPGISDGTAGANALTVGAGAFAPTGNTALAVTGISLSASTGTNATGASTPISLVQPTLIVNKIIKVH